MATPPLINESMDEPDVGIPNGICRVGYCKNKKCSWAQIYTSVVCLKVPACAKDSQIWAQQRVEIWSYSKTHLTQHLPLYYFYSCPQTFLQPASEDIQKWMPASWIISRSVERWKEPESHISGLLRSKVLQLSLRFQKIAAVINVTGKVQEER